MNPRVLFRGLPVLLACSMIGCSGADTAPSSPVPTAPSAAAEVARPATPGEFTTTESGLQYKIVRNADGKKPKVTDSVKVNYEGWLDNGTVFDSSYKRGEPISFPLRGVVPGWTEGLTYCPVGGEIELRIPPDLGYGPGGQGPIPPNATLNFKIELLAIE